MKGDTRIVIGRVIDDSSMIRNRVIDDQNVCLLVEGFIDFIEQHGITIKEGKQCE